MTEKTLVEQIAQVSEQAYANVREILTIMRNQSQSEVS